MNGETVRMKRKGIILAGGSASRLYPATLAVSKQLLPVFDKPLIYYPLSTLMLMGIRDILIISTPRDIPLFKQLLGTGEQLGVNFEYVIQPSPDGIAEAFILSESFIKDSPSVLILGDNIFYGHDLPHLFDHAMQQQEGATVFVYHVHDPERYGVAQFDATGTVISIEEKPLSPSSNYAVTGVYFYDKHATRLAKTLRPSKRGELEITDLNQLYLNQGQLNVKVMGRGHSWFDTGTHHSMLEASLFVHAVQSRQGFKIACIEEVAYHQGWIDAAQIEKLARPLATNEYGQYLLNILSEPVFAFDDELI